jgi:glycerophosphoryl diester phosphodiesterase
VSGVFAGGGGAILVGHRGGRGTSWPTENTIAAFTRAHAEGAPAIELDVRTCAGDHVIVMHDPELTRVTGGNDRRLVSRTTRGELDRVVMGAGRERVPTLDDVLGWARGRVAVNVEAKHDVPDRLVLARGIAAVLTRHPGVEVLLSSFDPTLLAMLFAVAPRAPRAWLTYEAQRGWEVAWVPLAGRAPIHAVHFERTQANPRTIARVKQAGKKVGVWTVNDAREARDLADLGVDWIITDDPGGLVASRR